MFPALPYYSHSSARGIQLLSNTTQGDEEHAELQENIYTNDSQGCYIAGMRPHKKNSFPLPIH